MTTSTTWTQRLTDGLLVSIVLAVGLMAGAASFNHVHDWTMHNSPAGTPGWFGWANAVITELIPTAALIIIARRRRNGGPIAYPMFLLIVAIGLSLTAQLAVAQPTVFGWMVSALPALAFFALSKLVFTATNAASTITVPASAPGTVDPAVVQALTARIADLETRPTTKVPARKPAAPARASSSSATGKARTAADSTTKAPRTPRKRTNPVNTTTSPTVAPTPAAAPAEAATGVLVDTSNSDEHHAAAAGDLLPTARLYAESHRHTTGEAITPGQLAVRMRIPTTAADRLLRAVNGTDHTTHNTTPANTGPHNGSRPMQDVTA